jgi:phosphonopyruvate decarboxylase
MGHTSSLSLGFCLKSNKKVFCLDGDGSLIMHMGSLITISSYKKIFKYILFNNEMHESVGFQKTNSQNIDFKVYSKSIGFDNYYKSDNINDFKKKYLKFMNDKKKSFFEIKFKHGSIKNLSRPSNFELIGEQMSN